MKNYIIEGNINFFSELYKSLDSKDHDNSEELNVCLITNEPLTDNFVKMNCGHKFNYVPLFKDILNHKKKFNSMESHQLCVSEIRCPYCRQKHHGVLPYYEELGFEKISGVNHIGNVSSSSSTSIWCCQFLINNYHFNPSIEENEATNPKLIKCLHYGSKIHYNDDNCYCYIHKRIMIKKYKMEKLEKIKEEKKKEKLLEKQKIKEEKDKIKQEKQQKIKEEKDKIKEEKQQKNIEVETDENVIIKKVKKVKKIKDENIVISNNNSLTNNCSKILKTGNNKGLLCDCKIFKDNLCKRHFTLQNKKNIMDQEEDEENKEDQENK